MHRHRLTLIDQAQLLPINPAIGKHSGSPAKNRFYTGLVVVLALLVAYETSAQSVTLSIDSNTIEEHDRSHATLTATIDEAQTTNLTIPLLTTGSAVLGADYDLDDITITSGETSGTTRFVPIRDWDQEGDENVQISVDTASNSQLSQDGEDAAITIEDSYRPGSGDSEPETGSDLFPYIETQGEQTEVNVSVRVFNLGSEASDPATLVIRLFDQSNLVAGEEVLRVDVSLPSIAVFPSSYLYEWEIVLDDLEADTTFVGLVDLVTGENSNELNEGNNRRGFGFSIDFNKLPVVTCESPSRGSYPGQTDPLFEHQWHLKNTGQQSFSYTEGEIGADMRMTETIESGYGGEGVVVAIVDEGLESCHPDLHDNVDLDESVNFLADSSSDAYWYGADPNDPFNPDTTGDHGTTIAGAVAAMSDNGLGGRGVASKATLRGFNLLKDQNSINLVTSFGGGTASENTVDVVNMSFGSIFRSEYNFGTYDLFGWFTRSVRDEKGTLFVKAAGNSFSSCGAIRHEIHSEIGCSSATSDYTSNLPFVMTVGAFNAQDRRSSYSSVGSNLWITSPAGQDGTRAAALLSTDQFGEDRGYGVLAGAFEPLQNANENRNGDYTGLLSGTSAAAAAMSGAVAVLLGVEPDLTFRDVKHIFAKTARKIQPDLPRVRVAVGNEPFILQHGWVTNAAGYSFHNWFGFGGVNIDGAVAMAEDYDLESLGLFAVTDWMGNLPISIIADGSHEGFEIPDADGAGLVDTFDVSLPLEYAYCGEDSSERHCIPEGSLDAVANPDDPDGPLMEVAVNIEGVQLRLVGDHPNMSDLSIELMSPSGTRSILIPVFNNPSARAITDNDEFHFLSNAFYGEKPEGTWELRVIDAVSDDEGHLLTWHLKFFVGQHDEDEGEE